MATKFSISKYASLFLFVINLFCLGLPLDATRVGRGIPRRAPQIEKKEIPIPPILFEPILSEPSIDVLCSLTGHEYVLEVAPAKQGFTITTNIPKVGALPNASPKSDGPIPCVKFNATTQQLVLTEDSKALEMLIDRAGNIVIQKLDMPDTLCLKNTTGGGVIHFEGKNPQKANILKLECQRIVNQADLSINVLKATASADFINNGSLIINKINGELSPDPVNIITCKNFENNNQLIVHRPLKCIVNDFFHNSSNMWGDGALEVHANKFLNDERGSVAIKGKLDILPSRSILNDALRCPWPCVLDNFSQATTRCLAFGGEWCIGFLGGSGQEVCLQLKDHLREKFNQNRECNQILLKGIINAGSMNAHAQNITLQGAIHINDMCTIKPLYVFSNAGSLYIKGNFDISDGDYFYNDVNSIISVGKSANLSINKIAVNISGAISAQDIKLKADKLINARAALTGRKEGVPDKPNFRYNQFETFPLGYIIARDGNINLNINEFYQEASILSASKDIEINTKKRFSNFAREIQMASNKVIKQERSEFCFLYCPDNVYETYGVDKKALYEPSTIAAGGDVSIAIDGEKINFNKRRYKLRQIPDFHNTGTIQGIQLVELDASDQDKLVNGFTHKSVAAVFSYLPSAADLYDDKMVHEYEHKQDGFYYYTHPLFNENKPVKAIQELAIVANSIQQEIGFLMSPLVEAMNLEFVLHKLAGRTRITGSQNCFDQLHELEMQGLIYAIVHGTLKLVGEMGTAKNNQTYSSYRRRPKNRRIPVQKSSQNNDSNDPEAENERKTIVLTTEERQNYQKLIDSVKGNISAEEYVRRLNALKAKTHVAVLTERQIVYAPISFIYYKTENYNGKDCLHPYFHPDEDSFENMRRADGILTGGDVKITGGDWQNFGFIKADKDLLINVSRFLNEKPLHERIDGIYKIIETKSGGEYEAGTANIATTNDLTFKGGKGTATDGSNTLTSTQGSVNILDQKVTNPAALDHVTMPSPSTLTAATDNNLHAKKDVKIVNSQTVAGHNTDINAGGTASITTTATPFIKSDETTHSGWSIEHKIEQGVAVVPAAMISGDSATMQAEKNIITGSTVQVANTLTLKASENIVQPTVVETATDVITSLFSWLFSYDHTKTTQTQQTIIPSTLQANEIVIESSELDTTLEAVVLYGGQLVHIVSGRDTIFKGTELHSSTQQKGWSFGISFFGSAALQALVDGNCKGSVISLTASDPLIAAITALSRAKDTDDKVAASEYVGIEALRGLVQLSKAAKLPVMTSIGQRLKLLDGAGKFRPQLTFSLGHHSAKEDKWETVPSQINAMKFVVESGNKTALRDGTQIKAQESVVKSNIVEFTAAANTQQSNNKHFGFDITFGPDGIGAGVHGGKGKSNAVHYQNAVFDVGSQIWQAEDMHGQGVTIKGRVGHFNVKNMTLSSVQNVEKGKEINAGVSASQSGAFSGFFNYHKVDNAWINQRSCLEFEELHGHAAMLKLMAADIIARQKSSTFKADKTEGQNLHDLLHTFGLGLGFGVSLGDVVPVTADFDYTKQHSGGVQKAYASEFVQTGQTNNIVRNENDKFVADKTVNTHVHFVAAWIDTPQAKQAFSDLKDMFTGKKEATFDDMTKKFKDMEKLGQKGDEKTSENGKKSPKENAQNQQEQESSGSQAGASGPDEKAEPKKGPEQKQSQDSQSQQPTQEQDRIEDMLLHTEFDFGDKNNNLFHVEAFSDLGDTQAQESDPKTLTITGQTIDRITGEPRLIIKVGRHQFRINPVINTRDPIDPNYIKPNTMFSMVPIEGAEFVPGHGWRVPPESFWHKMSAEDWTEIATTSVYALMLLADMPSSREGIKEGFKGIITNLKQSGIGKAGSKIYQVLRPAVQGAKTVVSKGYNAIKESVEPVVEKGASFLNRAKSFFGKLFGYETESVAGKVAETVGEGAALPKNIVGTAFNEIKPTQEFINPARVKFYADKLTKGEKIAPIKVANVPGKGKYIIEGHHRFVASQKTGIKIDMIIEESGPVGMNDWSSVMWKEFNSENQFWGN